MDKTYTLEENNGLMAELKSMRGKMAEMRGRLERDEITPDEWRQWYAEYQARLDEIKEAVLTTDEDNNEGWKGTDEELTILGVDDRTFRFNADYLLGVGVVVRIPRFDMNDDDGTLYYTNEYYVTQYGLEFVEYVKEVD